MSQPEQNDPLLEVLSVRAKPRTGKRSPKKEKAPTKPVEDKPSPKDLFERRWKALEARVKAIDDNVADKAYGDPTDPTLSGVVGKYGTEKQAVDQAKQQDDYGAANTAMDDFEKTVQKVEDDHTKLSAKQKNTFEQEKLKYAAPITRIQQAIAGNKYGNPVHNDFKDCITFYNNNMPRAVQAEQDGNYVKALSAIRWVGRGTRDLTAAVKKFDDRWKATKDLADSITAGIDNGDYSGLDQPIQAFKAAKATVLKDVPPEVNADKYGPAHDLIDTFMDEVKNFRKAQGTQLLAMTDETFTFTKTSRKKAQNFVARDPEILRELVEMQGGPQALDKLVKNVGGSAGDQKQKDFVAAAIKARYGLDELTGDLTTKALPRLYKVLSMVPDSHTKGNKRLKGINRSRQDPTKASDWSPTNDKINLNLGRTGFWDGGDTAEFDGDTGKKKKVDKFDSTTLHEVGHAVDAKEKYMITNGKAADHGGWDEHGIDVVVDKVGNDKGFYKAFPDYPDEFLKAYLLAKLKGKDPQNEASVTSKAPPKTPDWKTLGEHKAVEIAEAIRLKGEHGGFWWEGAGGAQEGVMADGRVYFETKKDTWVSYLHTARAKGISRYQFRAMEEWFAESYSAFYLKKLAKDHPVYKWLKPQG